MTPLQTIDENKHVELISAIKIATLWLFVLLCMLFRDVHETVNPNYFEQIKSQNTSDEILLASGVVLSFLVFMIPANFRFGRKARKHLNTIAVFIFLIGVTSMPPKDLDDYWFAIVEIIAIVEILRITYTKR